MGKFRPDHRASRLVRSAGQDRKNRSGQSLFARRASDQITGAKGAKRTEMEGWRMSNLQILLLIGAFLTLTLTSFIWFVATWDAEKEQPVSLTVPTPTERDLS